MEESNLNLVNLFEPREDKLMQKQILFGKQTNQPKKQEKVKSTHDTPNLM